MSGSLYPYPRGRTPDQLYETLRALADVLNRVSPEGGSSSVDLTAVNAAISAVNVQIDGIIEDLENLDTSGGLTDQQAFTLSLVTAVDEVLGSFSAAVLDTTRRAQEIADAAIRAALKGHENAAAITVEQTVRQTANESFASQISTINASLSNANAAITEEITARTDGDSANASSISTLSTTVSGHTSTLTTIQESVDGVESRYGIALTQNGEVTGLMQLDGTLQGTSFTVLADTFKVGNAAELGGAAVPVFAISTVNGTERMTLRGDMLADGSITAQHLSVLSLDAISGTLGTIRSGLIININDTARFDLTNMKLYRPDGKFTLDMKNLLFEMAA